MTADHQHGRFVFVCDVCGEIEEAADARYAFDAFWQALKDQGWQARKEDDDWEHFCPKCAEKQ